MRRKQRELAGWLDDEGKVIIFPGPRIHSSRPHFETQNDAIACFLKEMHFYSFPSQYHVVFQGDIVRFYESSGREITKPRSHREIIQKSTQK
jgi:hypothetical protein